ncbi:MAG TPA: hypothetical protein VIM10_12095 [Actinopolymorphaceae bacterium]
MTVDSANTVETPVPPMPGTPRPRARWSTPTALAVVLVVAVVAGIVWSQIAPRLHFLITVVGPFPVTEATAGQVVDADAWFAVLSIAVGLAAGVAALVVIRPLSRWRALVGLAITAVGLFVMFAIGQLLVNHRLVWSWNPVAGDNEEVTGPLVLQAWGVVTIAPIAALVIVLAASIVSDGPRRAG